MMAPRLPILRRLAPSLLWPWPVTVYMHPPTAVIVATGWAASCALQWTAMCQVHTSAYSLLHAGRQHQPGAAQQNSSRSMSLPPPAVHRTNAVRGPGARRQASLQAGLRNTILGRKPRGSFAPKKQPPHHHQCTVQKPQSAARAPPPPPAQCSHVPPSHPQPPTSNQSKHHCLGLAALAAGPGAARPLLVTPVPTVAAS